jgi:hypothetical protein
MKAFVRTKATAKFLLAIGAILTILGVGRIAGAHPAMAGLFSPLSRLMMLDYSRYRRHQPRPNGNLPRK